MKVYLVPEDIAIDIVVFEDDALVVVNKPAGLSGSSRARKLFRNPY